MEIKKIKSAFIDERGSITDILTNEEVDAITIITFKKGAVRANHYHKETTQWNYVLSGTIEAAVQKINETKEMGVLATGDLIVSEPNEIHAFRALEDSTLLILTKGPRAGKDYESDTFRLEKSLFEG